ncbi:hypothetical protein BJ085DRAFT_36127 [Dimargaris cristalligena]|uniref:Mediator of RNA polymerase II transcription subunit 25 von Willebrand factor type A domain-containing protein n=1 Tax=Dimargaris cristalligena TaxID=215637 RepID=A0A4P9ZWP4_9FUNG|nr:hypothetical protein BJ085DRAFT_36127 [Dimargaris cristalligena]|eukprot:RKP38047.1 hypothetical protein BJ085DRAFT_36127 [Dimargaris cristalligena]
MTPLPATVATPSIKKEVLCVIVLEDSEQIAQVFNAVYQTYLDPIIRYLRTPMLNSPAQGGPGNTKMTPLVRLGLVYYRNNARGSSTCVDRTSFISDYRLYRKIITQHQFAPGTAPLYAVTEGLVGALELFDAYQSSYGSDVRHTVQHCIVVGSTPFCPEAVRNNISTRYDDFTLARVLDTMKTSRVKLSVISPLGPASPALLSLAVQAAENPDSIVDVTKGPDHKLVAKLAGFTPPSLEVPKDIPESAASKAQLRAVPPSAVENTSAPIAEHTPPAKKKSKIDTSPANHPSPLSIALPTSPARGPSGDLRSPTQAGSVRKSGKAKGNDAVKTPKLKGKAKPKSTAVSSPGTMGLELSPGFSAGLAPSLASPIMVPPVPSVHASGSLLSDGSPSFGQSGLREGTTKLAERLSVSNANQLERQQLAEYEKRQQDTKRHMESLQKKAAAELLTQPRPPPTASNPGSVALNPAIMGRPMAGNVSYGMAVSQPMLTTGIRPPTAPTSDTTNANFQLAQQQFANRGNPPFAIPAGMTPSQLQSALLLNHGPLTGPQLQALIASGAVTGHNAAPVGAGTSRGALWTGNLIWSAKDRKTTKFFRHHAKVSAIPGTMAIRQSMRQKLQITEPDPLAAAQLPPAASPFSLEHFHLDKWSVDLESSTLVNLDQDNLLRFLLDHNIPYVEFTLLPEQNDPTVNSNFNSLISSLSSKLMDPPLPGAVGPPQAAMGTQAAHSPLALGGPNLPANIISHLFAAQRGNPLAGGNRPPLVNNPAGVGQPATHLGNPLMQSPLVNQQAPANGGMSLAQIGLYRQAHASALGSGAAHSGISGANLNSAVSSAAATRGLLAAGTALQGSPIARPVAAQPTHNQLMHQQAAALRAGRPPPNMDPSTGMLGQGMSGGTRAEMMERLLMAQRATNAGAGVMAGNVNLGQLGGNPATTQQIANLLRPSNLVNHGAGLSAALMQQTNAVAGGNNLLNNPRMAVGGQLPQLTLQQQLMLAQVQNNQQLNALLSANSANMFLNAARPNNAPMGGVRPNRPGMISPQAYELMRHRLQGANQPRPPNPF